MKEWDLPEGGFGFTREQTQDTRQGNEGIRDRKSSDTLEHLLLGGACAQRGKRHLGKVQKDSTLCGPRVRDRFRPLTISTFT